MLKNCQGGVQDGRVEEHRVPLPHKYITNTSKSGTVLTEYQLKVGRRSHATKAARKNLT